MKVSKTENRFKTGFKQPKTHFPKNPVLTSLIVLYIILYLYIYIELLAVHTNQKRLKCERPREKKHERLANKIQLKVLKLRHVSENFKVSSFFSIACH